MKKILRGLLAYMDRKWPDRVVVTQKDYDALFLKIRGIEAEIAKLNVSLGFNATAAARSGFENPFTR